MKNIMRGIAVFVLTIPPVCLIGYLLGMKECPYGLLLVWACVAGGIVSAFEEMREQRKEQKERQQLEGRDTLELEKELNRHLLTLQYLREQDRQRDNTRLPPEMLKAFQKDGQPCAKN